MPYVAYSVNSLRYVLAKAIVKWIFINLYACTFITMARLKQEVDQLLFWLSIFVFVPFTSERYVICMLLYFWLRPSCYVGLVMCFDVIDARLAFLILVYVIYFGSFGIG